MQYGSRLNCPGGVVNCECVFGVSDTGWYVFVLILSMVVGMPRALEIVAVYLNLSYGLN